MASKAQQTLSQSQSAYVMGSRPAEKRKSVKIIAGMIRLGFVACAVTGVAQIVPHFLDSEENALPPQVHQSSPSQEKWEILSSPQTTTAQSGPEQPSFKNVTSSSTPPQDIPSQVYDTGITVTDKDTHSSIVIKLHQKGKLFHAAIMQAEGLETKPYYIEGDSSQPTIGVGYNIKMSKTAIGASGVRQELTQAGISQDNIDKLMSSDQKLSSQASITRHQALALLDITAKRFEASTRAAIGASVYNKLPRHRQVALMMIDYNSNLHNRSDLIAAVRSGNTVQVVQEMETFGTVNGRMQRLANAALPQTMYYNEEGASLAVMRPETAKRQVAQGKAPWNRIQHTIDQSPQYASEVSPQGPVIHTVSVRYETASPELSSPEQPQQGTTETSDHGPGILSADELRQRYRQRMEKARQGADPAQSSGIKPH